jgi:tetratricopeptide (TPR) repeat protein
MHFKKYEMIASHKIIIMKLHKSLTIWMVLFTCLLYGQVDKRTAHVEYLFQENKFDEVVAYKRHRTKSLPAKVLYYKGMSYLQLEDLNNALIMFDRAIKKGPADINMYYYKSVIHNEQREYKKALNSINEAILLEPENPHLHSLKGEIYFYKENSDSALISLMKATFLDGCDAKTYLLIAEIKKENKEFAPAFEYYTKAMSKVEMKSDYHNFCSYNLGAMQQELQHFDSAKTFFTKHMESYPDDYSGMMKLIQVNSALNLHDENKVLRKGIYEASLNNKLPKKMSKSFCFEIFNWNENLVYAVDYYNPTEDKANFVKYKYIAYDKDDNPLLRVFAELDSLKKDSTLTLKLIRQDTCFTFSNLKFAYLPDFKQLSITVKEILENKHTPNDTLTEYGVWSDKIRAKRSSLANLLRDGSSFEKAVIAASIPKEYEFLREYYPGYTFKMQSLVFEEGKPYDILHIETIDGISKKVYFDISSFFGKGF